MVKHTAICIDKLVMKAMRRLAKASCAIQLDIACYGNAKASCFCELMCEGHCGGDSAVVSFSEAKRQSVVMAVRRLVFARRSVKVLVPRAMQSQAQHTLVMKLMWR